MIIAGAQFAAPKFPKKLYVGQNRCPSLHSPVKCETCGGAASRVGGGRSTRTWLGSPSGSLAHETSTITTTESAETRIIDFFMAGTVVDAAGRFNRRRPVSRNCL
jgi:hypothetical protein